MADQTTPKLKITHGDVSKLTSTGFKTLTPAPYDDTHWTGLASILDAMSLPNLTNLPTVLDALGIPNITKFANFSDTNGIPKNTYLNYSSYLPAVVKPVIAALTADDMSRVVVTELSQGGLPIYNPLVLRREDTIESIANSMMAGTYKFPHPTAGHFTELDFSVELTGLAYRADSNAYVLALVVLFLHAAFALALAHIAYVRWNRVFCNT